MRRSGSIHSSDAGSGIADLAAPRIRGLGARRRAPYSVVAGLTSQHLRADHMNRLPALFARQTGDAFGDIKARIRAGWALTAKPANQVARRALDRPHPGGIAVGAHIRFDEGRTAFCDDLANRFFQSRSARRHG